MGQTSLQQQQSTPGTTPATTVSYAKPVVNSQQPKTTNDSGILRGKKTYIVAIVMAIYAFSGYSLGDLTQQQMWMLILQAAGISGIRSAIANL